jgi:4-carboxymuconolactone decarboxylase
MKDRTLRAIHVMLALVVAFPPAMAAQAQNRMPGIPVEQMSDAQKKAIEEFKAARGTELSTAFVPLLRSPELMTRARAMGDYLRFKSALPPKLREFVILMVAREWTQQYEWNTHHAAALKAGLEPAIAAAIAEGRRPERLAKDEEILYEFCLELQRNRSVSDATYAKAVAEFGEQGVIDTIGIAGYYTFLAMVLNTARTPLPSVVSPGLVPLPR